MTLQIRQCLFVEEPEEYNVKAASVQTSGTNSSEQIIRLTERDRKIESQREDISGTKSEIKIFFPLKMFFNFN